MPNILLINPNASEATTAMMADIAQRCAPVQWQILARTAGKGPMMIVNASELLQAEADVEACWREAPQDCAGILISAFGDPGLERLRGLSKVPVVGIAEASILEAASGGRRFGIATVTPDLVEPIAGRVAAVGLTHLYTGIRLTEGDPRALAADATALEAALARAVQRCVDEDGAQAVIIGGGPLGQAAIALAERLHLPVIAPIPAAVRRLAQLMG